MPNVTDAASSSSGLTSSLSLSSASMSLLPLLQVTRVSSCWALDMPILRIPIVVVAGVAGWGVAAWTSSMGVAGACDGGRCETGGFSTGVMRTIASCSASQSIVLSWMAPEGSRE